MNVFLGFLLATAIISSILWWAVQVNDHNMNYKTVWGDWLLIYTLAVIIITILVKKDSPQ